MPFECKKYHAKCQARCCGVVPIPVPIWQRNQHNIQRNVIERHKVYVTDPQGKSHKAILPVTDNFSCPFLSKDLSCSIYHDRPEICKKYGDESHWALTCPMQTKEGNPRTEEETASIEEHANRCIAKKSPLHILH